MGFSPRIRAGGGGYSDTASWQVSFWRNGFESRNRVRTGNTLQTLLYPLCLRFLRALFEGLAMEKRVFGFLVLAGCISSLTGCARVSEGLC